MSRRSVSRIIGLVFLGLAMALTRAAHSRPTLAQPDPPRSLVRIEVSGAAELAFIDKAGFPVLAHLATPDSEYLLAIASADDQTRLRDAGFLVDVLDPDAATAAYYLIPTDSAQRIAQASEDLVIVFDDGRRAVGRLAPGATLSLEEARAVPLVRLGPAVVLSPALGGAVPTKAVFDPLVDSLVAQVTTGTLHSAVGGLSGERPVEVGGALYTLSTRYSYSGTPLTKATQYVYEQMEALGYDVSYHMYSLSDQTLRNVIGEKLGMRHPERVVLLAAHLDSRAAGAPHDPAPGADDNASGSAALMVAAELLASVDFEDTVRLAFFTGEEQGMYGSYYYALDAYNAAEDIRGVLNLDMISWDAKGGPQIDIHSDSPSVEDDSDALADLFASVVDTYGLDLSVQIVEAGATFSDHYRFWQQGYAAVLAIEDYYNPSEAAAEPRDWNTNYHTVNDRLDTLNLVYFREYVRASLGTFVHLARPIRTISGTVTSASSGAPISAAVAAEGTTGVYTTTTGSAGAYALRVPGGRYTVTASSRGYGSQAIADIGVVTSTGVTLDFALIPLPAFTVSGTLTEAGSGDPLSGTVRFGDDLIVATNGGHYSATVFSGTYSAVAQAPFHYLVARTVVVDRDQRQDFALTGARCLLVVDDDYDDKGVPYDDQAFYTATLDALGLEYDVWAVPDDVDGPPLAALRQYRGVVWLTGRDWDTTLTASDQAALAGYLDGGGRLFISGQDIGWDLADAGDPPAFYTDYLHARYLADTTDPRDLAGVDWMSGIDITIAGGDGADNQEWPSEIDPVGAAVGIFRYTEPSTRWGAIAFADDTYRVVYFAFGFEAINNGDDRRAVMQRALEYLEPCTHLSSEHVVSGTLTNATSGEPLSGTVRFGDDLIVQAPTGHYSATLARGTYDVVAQASYYNPLTRTIVVDSDQRQDFALVRTPCLLVVDDDYDNAGNPYDDQIYYTSTLDGLGLEYDVWTVPDDGDGPALETLGRYRGIVWLTGRDWDTTLTASDQAALAGYLDGGGRLFVSGQDIGWDLADAGDSPAFYTDYLHARYVADASETWDLHGVGWMSGVDITIAGGDGADNQDYPSEIDSRGDAVDVFHYADASANWGAIAYADDAYRVVYFGFGFEAINSNDDRRETMTRVLEYLAPCPRPPVEAAAFLPVVLAE